IAAEKSRFSNTRTTVSSRQMVGGRRCPREHRARQRPGAGLRCPWTLLALAVARFRSCSVVVGRRTIHAGRNRVLGATGVSRRAAYLVCQCVARERRTSALGGGAGRDLARWWRGCRWTDLGRMRLLPGLQRRLRRAYLNWPSNSFAALRRPRRCPAKRLLLTSCSP
ncbi:hypothetical protein BD310DRAFT_930331, partial [Dichomitus squalens]